MGYAIGIVLAACVFLLGRVVGFERDRAFYPTVVVAIASYYVLFAVMGGSMQALIVESIVMGAFTLAAVIGFKGQQGIVVVALAAHGTFDFFHTSLVTNPGVPEWWPAFCLAFDVGLAACLAWLSSLQASRGGQASGNARSGQHR